MSFEDAVAFALVGHNQNLHSTFYPVVDFNGGIFLFLNARLEYMQKNTLNPCSQTR